MEGRASGTAILVGPSGNNWYAELILVGDGLFFSDGWEAFVNDHFLVKGDFLVFRYDENLQFTVLVFDQSMCEKEAALKADNHRDINQNGGRVVEKRDRDISALPDSMIEGVPKRARCSEILSECVDKINLDSTNIGDDNGAQEVDQNSKLNNAVTVAVSPCAAVQNDYSGNISKRLMLDIHMHVCTVVCRSMLLQAAKLEGDLTLYIVINYGLHQYLIRY